MVRLEFFTPAEAGRALDGAGAASLFQSPHFFMSFACRSYHEEKQIFLTLHRFPVSCRCLAAALVSKPISIKYERTAQRHLHKHTLHEKKNAVLVKRTACSSPHLFMQLCRIRHLAKLRERFFSISRRVLTRNYS